MARPHTCFVQAQFIPWTPARWLDPLCEADIKTLSADDNESGLTGIIKIPAGADLRGPTHFGCNFEFFVLDGMLEINGIEYTKECYAFLPAGHLIDVGRSPYGAILLCMFDGLHHPISGNVFGGLYREDRLAIYKNTFEMEWKTGEAGSVTGKPLSSTIFTKKLRYDHDTHEQTFLYAALPHHAPPSIMRGKFGHPMIEEIFVLSGEYVFGDVGRMGSGGYCWWRENEMHGPAGSEVGYNLFIRTYGGPLKNTFSAQSSSFSFRPAHNPVLPDHLVDYAQPFPFADPW